MFIDNIPEKEPEFHFRITLEDTATKIEHTYKEAYNPNSEHDVGFPALPAKFDAIITALKASGHSDKEIKEDMKDYIEWQESEVWGVLRKVEEQLEATAFAVSNGSTANIEQSLRDILKIIEEAN